jgi:hypothetical protein
MSRHSSHRRSDDDRHPDPPSTLWAGADVENAPDYVQTASEVGWAMRQHTLAKVARRAAHRRGEFRWYEFRVRRRYTRRR